MSGSMEASMSAPAPVSQMGRGSDRAGRMKKMMNSRNNRENADLLTAALVGVAVGVVGTLIVRQAVRDRRPIMAGLAAAGRGMRKLGVTGMAAATGRTIARGVQHGVDRGVEMVEEIPFDDIADHVRDYFDAAKEAVEDTISGELRDLKRSIRRRRRRLGI